MLKCTCSFRLALLIVVPLCAAPTSVGTAAYFAAPLSLDVGTQPIALRVADVNNDKNPDLAVVSRASGTVSVLLGNGDGTFQAKHDFAVGNLPLALAVGDFNGDGKPDLVSANAGNASVSILLGNGDGTFQAKRDFGVGTLPLSVDTSDFNHDGKLDLSSLTE